MTKEREYPSIDNLVRSARRRKIITNHNADTPLKLYEIWYIAGGHEDKQIVTIAATLPQAIGNIYERLQQEMFPEDKLHQIMVYPDKEGTTLGPY